MTVTGRRVKMWNINTPKFHALGDVASYIRSYGTTDSYSTQLVRQSFVVLTIGLPFLTVGALSSLPQVSIPTHEQEESISPDLSHPNMPSKDQEDSEIPHPLERRGYP